MTPDGAQIKLASQEAELGKRAHRHLAELVDTGGWNLPEQEDHELVELLIAGQKLWEQVRGHFPTPRTECILEQPGSFEVQGVQYKWVGTADVLSPRGEAASILDWKTGWHTTWEDCQNQLTAEAFIVWELLGRPRDVEITTICALVRSGELIVRQHTPRRLEEWEYDLVHNVLPNRDVYSPGSHCTWCRHYYSCPARRELVAGTISAFALPPSLPAHDPYRQFAERAQLLLSQLTPENKTEPEVGAFISELMLRLDLADRAITNVRDMLRDAISRVGPIPTHDGYSLTFREVKSTGVDPVRALPVLRGLLSERQILHAMSLSWPKLAASYCAGLHGKSAARRQTELERRLDEAGALIRYTRRMLVECEDEKR